MRMRCMPPPSLPADSFSLLAHTLPVCLQVTDELCLGPRFVGRPPPPCPENTSCVPPHLHTHIRIHAYSMSTHTRAHISRALCLACNRHSALHTSYLDRSSMLATCVAPCVRVCVRLILGLHTVVREGPAGAELSTYLLQIRVYQ